MLTMDNDLIHRDQALDMLAKQKQLTLSVVRRVLLQIPTVDAVEVVRCKDCESFLRDSDLLQRHICIRWYPGSTRIVKPDDFCSYGKRKEGLD